MIGREEFIFFAKISHIGYGSQKEFKEGVFSKIEGWRSQCSSHNKYNTKKPTNLPAIKP